VADDARVHQSTQILLRRLPAELTRIRPRSQRLCDPRHTNPLSPARSDPIPPSGCRQLGQAPAGAGAGSPGDRRSKRHYHERMCPGPSCERQADSSGDDDRRRRRWRAVRRLRRRSEWSARPVTGA
jgi:hypothetical protein